jgi:hypothetical protein
MVKRKESGARSFLRGSTSETLRLIQKGEKQNTTGATGVHVTNGILCHRTWVVKAFCVDVEQAGRVEADWVGEQWRGLYHETPALGIRFVSTSHSS